MKILLLVQNYYPSRGGTQLLFQKTAEKWVELYHDEVEVFTSDSFIGPEKKQYKKISPAVELVNNIKVTRFTFFRFHLPVLRFIIKILGRLKLKTPDIFIQYLQGPWSPAMKKAIIKSTADVILGGSCRYLHMRYPLWRGKHKNAKPFVFQGAIHFTEESYQRNVLKTDLQAIQKSEYYISNTSFETKCLVNCGIDAAKITTAGCGVDLQFFAKTCGDRVRTKLGLARTDMLVGYVGRIEATKNIGLLMESFEMAASLKDDVHLLIAGYVNEEYLNSLQRHIGTMSSRVGSRIHFITNISEEEKADVFAALDIFVLPSISESFGIVFLEAWACKKPVIGMASGAIKSVISNNEDGLLSMPNNAADLCEKILSLCNDASYRQLLGANGYNKTTQDYTWDTIAKKYRYTFVKAVEKFASSKNNQAKII